MGKLLLAFSITFFFQFCFAQEQADDVSVVNELIFQPWYNQLEQENIFQSDLPDTSDNLFFKSIELINSKSSMNHWLNVHLDFFQSLARVEYGGLMNLVLEINPTTRSSQFSILEKFGANSEIVISRNLGTFEENIYLLFTWNF